MTCSVLIHWSPTEPSTPKPKYYSEFNVEGKPSAQRKLTRLVRCSGNQATGLPSGFLFLVGIFMVSNSNWFGLNIFY